MPGLACSCCTAANGTDGASSLGNGSAAPPAPTPRPTSPTPYGYFWWIDGKRPESFYALGNYGQYIYVDPQADVVVVRLGSDWGFGNEAWLATFRAIADQLTA